MKAWQWLMDMLNPAASKVGSQFTLGDRGSQPAVEDRGPTLLVDAQVRAEGVLTHIDNLLEAGGKGKQALEQAGDLSSSMDENVQRLKKLFRMPENKDLIIRDLTIATQPPTRAVVCFMEGLTDKVIINDHILTPLMLLAHLDHHAGAAGEAGPTEFSIDTLIKRLLPGHQTAEKYDMAAIAESLLAGDTILFFENEKTAVSVETKSPPGRSVGEPTTEKVIQGSKDAFVEAWRVNVALVRRRLKDPRVVTDILKVGRVSNNYVGLMYIDGIASPKLVAEIRRRIEAIDVDIINSAGTLEQYIEDAPNAWMPGMMTTERPDRTAGYLSEGNVALLVDNVPYALIAPVTFWTLLQTAEDYHLRYPFGTFIRWIRLTALLITVLVPALYIAVVNYHHEMIPTELMLFIASTREHVPLPALVELIIMDLSFELIREAGTRIPSAIGSTVGLVASLVLGQAAVEAKLISPLMVLIVAVTGLASFAIPNYVTSFGVRTWRFLVLAGAAVLGFYGLAAAVFVLVLYMAGLRSFGVPFLSPVAPLRSRITDALSRSPLFEMEMRPSYTRPVDRRRQQDIVRKWDPFAPGTGSEGGSKGLDEGGTP
ncbi:MAG TPA: spore germination protein [Symbiobacteriaceae bacterium]|nr:spore germination protein [Symbiobacteriaceae bacterium]